MEPTRALPRLRKRLTLILPDGWQAEVVDLSATGLRMQSLVLLEVGTAVEGSLVLPQGETVPVKGEVIWAQPPDHENRVPAEMGLLLHEVPERYLQALAGLFAD